MDVLSHLLTTNTAPNPTEEQHIQEEIRRISNAIEKLELEAQACKALLSPLRRFPLEVLGDIFGATFEPSDGIFSLWRPRQLIRLCLVCKAWQHAAIATPQLWATLRITFDRDATCFEGARLWVSRAGNTPLTLILNPRHVTTLGSLPYEQDLGQPHRCPLLNSGLLELFKAGPRIGALSVTCQLLGCLQRLADAVGSQSWCSIYAFEFRVPVLAENWSTWTHQVFPYIPPSAKSLLLRVPFVESDDFRVERCARTRTLLGNLTSLTFTMTWPNTLEKTPLSLCPGIQTLCLELRHPSNDSGWTHYEPGSIVTLPNLHTLQITGGAGLTSNHPVLNSLKAPRLISLDMKLNDDDYFYRQRSHSEVRDGLVSLIERSGCDGTFRRLRIETLNITSDGLVELLAALPRITHLTLDYVSTSSDSLFRNPKVYQEKLFSRLQVFEWYHMPVATRFQDICKYFSELPDVNAGQPTLKKLILQSKRGMLFPEYNTGVATLKEAGVEVDITDQGCG